MAEPHPTSNRYNSVMSERPRYPENAPGHFYVEEDLCILCDTPAAAAPDLVQMNENHCYFRKQPSTETELELAIEAVNACCCGAYRYNGDHLDVMARLSEDACDKPPRVSNKS
jgi:ferredoxin